MTNLEFTSEAIKRLMPDTSWYGESTHDRNSVENMDILDVMLEQTLEELFEDSFVPECRGNNDSYQKIAKRKQATLDWIFEYVMDHPKVADYFIQKFKEADK